MDGFGPLINSIMLLVFGAGMTALSTWFWFVRNTALQKARDIAADHDTVKARLAAAENQLMRIDQVIVPINTMMQALLVKQLTHAHTPEMDQLMAKLGPPSQLTDEENERLLELLEERSKDKEHPREERKAAEILPVIMERAQAEQDLLTTAGAFNAKLVSLVTVIGVPNTVDKAGEAVAEKEADEKSETEAS